MDKLQYALENGIIDMSYIQQQVDMNKKKSILEKHPYAISKGKDGKWRTYIPDANNKGKRRMIKRSSKDAIFEVLIRYYLEEEKKESDKQYRFQVFFEMWRERQISYEVSNNTIYRYDADYNRFFKNTDFENMDIREINEEDITAFIIKNIKKYNLKEKTGKMLIGYIKGIFKHARVKKVISENPCDYVDMRMFTRYYNNKNEKASDRIMNDNDMALLLKEIDKTKKKRPEYIPNYAVLLSIYTGMRIGELAGLKWEDVREKDGVIVICHSEKYDHTINKYYVGNTKTGRERQFPLSPKLIDLFHEVKKVEMQYGYLGEYVFQDAQGRIHTRAIDHCLRRRCASAGIPVKSIHDLRRTFNSKLRCAGVSVSIASSLLGHSEEVNISRYTYDISDMDYKRDVVAHII